MKQRFLTLENGDFHIETRRTIPPSDALPFYETGDDSFICPRR